MAFGGTAPCSGNNGDPGNLNAIPIFQGTLNQPGCAPSAFPLANANLGYLPNQQQFQALNFPQSVFLNQNYLNLNLANPAQSTFLPLGFQPFGYPQAKNFVYAYSQQAHFAIERDLGGGYALTLAYNFNGGRHLNRPINANTIRGDLMVANFNAALAGGQTPASPLTVGGALGAKAPDWAIGATDAFASINTADVYRRNHFTVYDAREAMFRALTLKGRRVDGSCRVH